MRSTRSEKFKTSFTFLSDFLKNIPTSKVQNHVFSKFKNREISLIYSVTSVIDKMKPGQDFCTSDTALES